MDKKGKHFIAIKADKQKTIPKGTFNFTNELTELHIPACITKIGTNNFIGCPYLKDIYFYSAKAPKLEYVGGEINKSLGSLYNNSSNPSLGGNIFTSLNDMRENAGASVKEKSYHTPLNGKGYDAANYKYLLQDAGYKHIINN